jgi:hypothetical protein
MMKSDNPLMRKLLSFLIVLALIFGAAANSFAGGMLLLGAGSTGGGGGGGTTTFDPANHGADLTLSGGNLTATGPTGSGPGYEQARSITSHSSGKFYAEYTIVAVGSGSANLEIGVGNNAAVADTGGLGFDANLSSGCFGSASSCFTNSAGVGTGQPAFTTTNVVSIAVDLTNNAYWYQVNGGGYFGTASGSPTANTNGIPISAITGPFFLYVSLNTAATSVSMTANFGATAFSFAAPSGFGNW